MLGAFDAPLVGPAERRDQRIGRDRNRRGLEPVRGGQRHRSVNRQPSFASATRRYMPSYCGPPPPSGGTQSITWYGSMMSQVLQWTQFEALICSFFVPSPASTIS